MLVLQSSTQGRSHRSFRLLTRSSLLVAALVGPACHDAVAPKSPPPIPSFTIVSGDAQTASAGSELPQPIVAQATDGTGAPIAGLTVFFVVTQGGGHLYAGGGVTNTSGNVQDYWTLGTVAGVPQIVEVRAVDPTTGAKNSYGTFTATAIAGPAAILKVKAGDGQTGFTRALLPVAPAALVTDVLGNPVAGVSVNFALTAGGGTITGTPSITDANGTAALGSWRLGRAPGINRVTATSAGLAGSPIQFVATAKFGMAFVALGGAHSCGLNAANDVYCWGLNNGGQLGDGTRVNKLVPVRLLNSTLQPSTLDLGDDYSCMVSGTGKAYCWGGNTWGQLGNGGTTSATNPVAVSGTTFFTRIAAGQKSTCALDSSGNVWCWGLNGDGSFGDGTTTSSKVPVPAASGLTFKSIHRGRSHTCGLTTGGKAWCWGANLDGQVGDGTLTDTARVTPVLVKGGLTFTSLELGTNYSCGLIAGGTAYCWGHAPGLIRSTGLPQVIPGALKFTQLAAGDTHTCGISLAGAIYCWGTNADGELGTGSSGAAVLAPTVVAGGRRFTSISAGSGARITTGGFGTHTCAIPVDGGNPLCWGYNAQGQVGNGSTVMEPFPVEVVTPPIP